MDVWEDILKKDYKIYDLSGKASITSILIDYINDQYMDTYIYKLPLGVHHW